MRGKITVGLLCVFILMGSFFQTYILCEEQQKAGRKGIYMG